MEQRRAILAGLRPNARATEAALRADTAPAGLGGQKQGRAERRGRDEAFSRAVTCPENCGFYSNSNFDSQNRYYLSFHGEKHATTELTAAGRIPWSTWTEVCDDAQAKTHRN